MALPYYKPAILLIILSAAFFMYGGEYANAAAECTPACGILERCQEPGVCVPIASAQTNAPAPGSEGSFFSCTNPIVPCGREGTPQCDLCYLYNLAGNVVNFCLFCLILPIAVVSLLLGGIFLLASRGNPQMLEWGKTAMVNVVIGVIIAFAAWLIIATIINTLGYGGFTAAWNVPPQCETTLINQRTAGGPGGASGPSQTCEQGVDVAESCSVGNCPGTRECQQNNTWSSCVKDDPSCESGGGGSCPTLAAGPCSASNLNASCFGGRGEEASQICRGESGGNRKAHGDPVTGNGQTVFRSIGLFQINLSVHTIAGLDCPSAFEGHNKPLKATPEARALYNKCVAEAEKADVNITKACEIRNAAGNWGDWTVARQCNL